MNVFTKASKKKDDGGVQELTRFTFVGFSLSSVHFEILY